MAKNPLQFKLLYDEKKAAKRAYDLEYNKRSVVLDRRREQQRVWKAEYRKKKQAAGKCTRGGCDQDLFNSFHCREHRDYANSEGVKARRRVRHKLKVDGVCRYCAGEAIPGKTMCRKCADQCNDRSKINLYGITLADYRQMLIEAKGVCTICGSDKRLKLDHDHATGNIRGILCHNCNVALGLVYDDDARLRALADYVVLHRALAMPKAV